MTASRDDLHRLVYELPDDQVAAAAEELRRHTTPRPVPMDAAFARIGAGPADNGRNDNAERMDELLAEGFGHN